MKNAVLKFELGYWLSAPIFYLLVGCFFLLSFVSMLGTGGFFDEPVTSSENVKLLNTPFALSSISALFSKFSLFFVAVFAGFSLYRDYKNNTHAILYSFPFTKGYYLTGKLLSVCIVIGIGGLAIFLGFGFAELLLGTNNPKIGVMNMLAYLVAAGVYFLPTLLIIGIFVFTAAGFTRSIFSGFIVVICFVLFQNMVENTLFNYEYALVLLDPFGQFAFMSAIKDWGITLQNSSTLPINLWVFLNRGLWLLLAAGFFSLFYHKFNFQYDTIWQPKKITFKQNTLQKTAVDYTTPIQFSFTWKAQLNSLFNLLKFDVGSILKNWMFLLICLFGILTIFFIQLRVTNTGQFNLLPYTRIILGAPLSIYSLIIMFSTFLFSGILVHKARMHRMNLLVNVTSVRNWQLFGANIIALLSKQVVLLLLFLLVALSIQIANDHFLFEFDLYLYHILILVLPTLFVWNVCSVFIHTVFPNLFLGLFVLLGIWLGPQSLDQVGIDTFLLKFNLLPALNYSDFYGYGSQLNGYLMLLLFWLILGFIFVGTTSLFWNRGTQSSIKERLHFLKERLDLKTAVTLVVLFILFAITGFRVYQAEEIDKNNSFQSRSALETFETYKGEWGNFQHLKLPKIASVDLDIALQPTQAQFTAKGIYTLVNNHDVPLDTILVRTGFDEKTELKWEVNTMLLQESKLMKTKLFKLEHPLAPNDSIQLHFTIKSMENTLLTRNPNVLANGTYLGADFLPRLGYQFVEHELPLSDSLATRFNYFHRDVESVTIHTKISTSSGQIALAPGELVNKEMKENTAVYEYQTASPVKFNFSFHSADFRVIEENYKGKQLKIYTAKNHTSNALAMLEGLKAALDFNTKVFGEYPHEQIRIVEFPHTEGGYSATLTANNIPTSEMLFIMNAKAMKGKINLPFYVMSHELTHQWFGNDLNPADAEGAKMLTESITEYLSLIIYRKRFGEEMAQQFLKTQLNRYQRGKKNEVDQERSLARVLTYQEYIAYGKGAIVFHLLAQMIGEDKLLSVLSDFVEEYGNRHTHYPTTSDFIGFLKERSDSQHHPLIDELFTTTSAIEDKMMEFGE